jgi:exosortase
VRHRQLVRELAIAGVVGALFTASPLTGDELGRAAVVGFGIAAVVFAFRVRNGLPQGDADAVQIAERSERAVPLAVWAAFAIWALVFWPTMAWLWHFWTASVWVNNHGVFMPPLIALLAHNALRDDSSEAGESSRWGFAWIIGSLALHAIDSALRTGYLGVLALIASLPGLALLLLGARRTRLLAVPLSLGLLMVPVPAAVATSVGLRHLTADGVEPLLHALGVSALRKGTVIQLAGEGNVFVVANACSGIATLYAGVTVAIVLACYSRTHWRRIFLLLVAAPLAIAANVVRVLALILMSSGIGKWVMESPLHPLTGVATFAIVVGGLLLAAGRDPLRDLA